MLTLHNIYASFARQSKNVDLNISVYFSYGSVQMSDGFARALWVVQCDCKCSNLMMVVKEVVKVSWP